jgi:hypothetical protein
MDDSTLRSLTELTAQIYHRYGISEPPERNSKMSSKKKINFFLDMMEAHDTSSTHANAPLTHKMLLNRRYNNTYKHAVDVLSQAECVRLHTLMGIRRIGAQNN